MFDSDYKKFLEIKIIKKKFDSLIEAVSMLLNKEPLFCTETLKSAVKHFVGDLTFLEIFNQNGWNLNITVTDG